MSSRLSRAQQKQLKKNPQKVQLHVQSETTEEKTRHVPAWRSDRSCIVVHNGNGTSSHVFPWCDATLSNVNLIPQYIPPSATKTETKKDEWHHDASTNRGQIMRELKYDEKSASIIVPQQNDLLFYCIAHLKHMQHINSTSTTSTTAVTITTSSSSTTSTTFPPSTATSIPSSDLIERTLSNIQFVTSRGCFKRMMMDQNWCIYAYRLFPDGPVVIERDALTRYPQQRIGIVFEAAMTTHKLTNPTSRVYPVVIGHVCGSYSVLMSSQLDCVFHEKHNNTFHLADLKSHYKFNDSMAIDPTARRTNYLQAQMGNLEYIISGHYHSKRNDNKEKGTAVYNAKEVSEDHITTYGKSVRDIDSKFALLKDLLAKICAAVDNTHVYRVVPALTSLISASVVEPNLHGFYHTEAADSTTDGNFDIVKIDIDMLQTRWNDVTQLQELVANSHTIQSDTANSDS